MAEVERIETREERTARLGAMHREQLAKTVQSVQHVLLAEPQSEEEWRRALQIHPLPEQVQEGVKEFAESIRGKTGAIQITINLLEAASGANLG